MSIIVTTLSDAGRMKLVHTYLKLSLSQRINLLNKMLSSSMMFRKLFCLYCQSFKLSNVYTGICPNKCGTDY